jgi:hypothetical protein
MLTPRMRGNSRHRPSRSNNNLQQNKQIEHGPALGSTKYSMGESRGQPGAGTLLFYRCFGDTATVRILRRNGHGTAVTVRNLLRETAVVCGLFNRWSAEEKLPSCTGMGMIHQWGKPTRHTGEEERENKGKTNGDIAAWSNCTA